MSLDLLWQWSATELSEAYRSGSTDPVQAAQACLQRMDAVNPGLNAVILRRDEQVLHEARESAQRWRLGQPLSVLDGIPITVKDSLFMAGYPTTWGCLGLAGQTNVRDELAVARARAGGALVLGKTNVSEFALEGYTDNPVFGPTGNPWAPALTPGGSSGGAVSAVASGMGPLAIGQDGGGSIRRPACHAGVVGLKPSLSAWPREHTLPSLLLDFEVIGPIGRTVSDVQMMFRALRGPADVDRSSMAAAWAAQRCGEQAGKPMKVLYVERLGAAPLDPEVAASVRQAVTQLQRLGHNVQEAELPLDLAFFNQAWPQIGQIGLAHLFERHPELQAQASDKFKVLAEMGRAVPAQRLWEILEQVRALRQQSARLFSEWDLVVMPSAAALPWPATQPYPSHIDGQEVGPRGHAIYTGWVNAAGLPALALPTGFSASGCPIGMQIVAGYGGDEQLLQLGLAYEQAAPWAQHWPNL
ncbi:amidase [Limnohabitans sp.]|jgi:aspartyl-tRNA(Asn)/glutamyl-tRNA(Gln) amidotransferase subunit A|uniref:amidase n=1 Tax=Limnohabitans sp. TaxID=1907725 RepID=UPI0037BFAD1D